MNDVIVGAKEARELNTDRVLLTKAIADKLRDGRIKAGYKGYYVAEKLNVSPAQYCRYEGGKCTWIPACVLQKATELFGVTFDHEQMDKAKLVKRIAQLEKENKLMRELLAERKADR